MQKQAVILGQGFGDIKFGLSEEQVTTLLGPPDEIEEQVYGEDEQANVYYYDSMGISMSFDSEENYKLVEISFEDEAFILLDNIRVGMSRDEFLKAAQQLGEYELEDLSGEGFENKELFTFEDANVNIWMDTNGLESIQIGPFWEDDETIQWPK
jgi:hypothetical protein